MRFTFALLALSTVYASATASIIARQSLPNCAAPCLTGSSVNYGGCSPQDNTCLCNSQTFVQSSTACIEKSCSGSDLATAEAFAQAICASVGVTLSATAPSASATSSSAAPSTTKSSSALSHGVDALVGLTAVGLTAFML